ncbi:MAG: electron transport complex subunit RsxC, partial [Verrucomicrobia bacterium A1]
PVVQVKQEVAMGDKIGDAKGFISAPVHTSIAGTVMMPSVTTLPNGRHVKTIPIKAGPNQLSGDALKQEIFGGDWPTTGLEQHDPKKIAEAVREAGLVGQGGAAFPTHVKLVLNEKRPVDTLLVNGCECEPYLTSDYRLMVEFPAPVVTGALLAARACGAKQILIAIEDNKPAAADAMRKAAEGTPVKIAVVHTKYPMGGERQVIPAVLKREVPTGGLPLDVGVVVINVGTAAAIARAVLRGKALTHRVVSVTGRGIKTPKNLLVPIGITYGELIDFCGGLTPDAARVVVGGPMMGFSIAHVNIPVTKGTSGIVVLTQNDVKRAEETPCVRCGRCVDVCPLHLVPTKMALASKFEDWDLAKSYHLMACCECGCCAYVCPANIPLVQLMRKGKAQLPRE